MEYKKVYKSNLDNLIMTSDGEYLTGLWFEKSNDETKHKGNYVDKDLPIFEEVIKWLDIYFSGIEPSFTPKYKINNITPFRQSVINLLLKIPYGKVETYGSIGEQIAKEKGIKKMSNRAVGRAVGWNPICIIIPCHRVVGRNNNLVGYRGGINKKQGLLKLEHIDISKFYIPKKGNKL